MAAGGGGAMFDEAEMAPEELKLPSDAMDLHFHPKRPAVAVGCVDGSVHLATYSRSESKVAASFRYHTDSCRSIRFSDDGNYLFTSSSDRSLRAIDVQGKPIWNQEGAHDSAINAMELIGNRIVATGDDDGGVKLWDTRTKSAIMTKAPGKLHSEPVSAVYGDAQRWKLLTTGCDGVLGVVDLRGAKKEAIYDHDDELLSVAVLKQGSKVVCGTTEGALLVFDWGKWSAPSDSIQGHPESVDALLKLDEDHLLTGSSDGIIRVVSVCPKDLVGILGEHADLPIERLQFSHDRQLVGSVSHDECVRFWDATILQDDDDDEEEAAAGEEAAGQGEGAAAAGAAGEAPDLAARLQQRGGGRRTQAGGGQVMQSGSRTDFFDGLM